MKYMIKVRFGGSSRLTKYYGVFEDANEAVVWADKYFYDSSWSVVKISDASTIKKWENDSS